jgi:hypothetical protein
MFTNKYLQRRWRPGFGCRTLLALLITGALQPSFAESANTLSFVSAEQAVEALYRAVETDDQSTMSRLVGRLASSDDMIQDKADRQLFVQKYAQMHRLVAEPDGTTVLYLGAENWPFPVPLVSDHGKWRFDVDAGAQEIMYRRIGENETTAMGTCRAIARTIGQGDSNTEDDEITAYAQKFVGAANPISEPFHGYYFRVLRSPNETAVIAYPSEYGSTGVMTFAVTAGGGPVYEKDLGPKTTSVATSLNAWTPNAGWEAVQ